MGKIKIKRLTVDIAYDPEGIEDEGRIVGNLEQVIDQSVPNKINTRIVNVEDIYDSDKVEIKTPFNPTPFTPVTPVGPFIYPNDQYNPNNIFDRHPYPKMPWDGPTCWYNGNK